jgi:type 1 fimbriae regulatory protein FimB/type 1 fimbriae regulatory protein FimE
VFNRSTAKKIGLFHVTCRNAPSLVALANRGHDTRALPAYLGHKNIQHTVRYTELSPARFKDFWRQ